MAGEIAMRTGARMRLPAIPRSCHDRISNRKLTYRSLAFRLGHDLQQCLRHFVKRGQHLGAGLVALLRRNHMRELSGEIHVRLLNGTSGDRAIARNGGLPDHGRTRSK